LGWARAQLPLFSHISPVGSRVFVEPNQGLCRAGESEQSGETDGDRTTGDCRSAPVSPQRPHPLARPGQADRGGDHQVRLDLPVDARGWSAAQKAAYVIADNRITENGRWDDELLKLELGTLQEAGFEVAVLGLSAGDMKRLERRENFGDADVSGSGRMRRRTRAARLVGAIRQGGAQMPRPDRVTR
jgi:hypothetical protein